MPIQATIGNKVVARSTIKAMRKTYLQNVTAVTFLVSVNFLISKKKVKRMKSVGSVEVPQEAFMAVLKMDDN